MPRFEYSELYGSNYRSGRIPALSNEHPDRIFTEQDRRLATKVIKSLDVGGIKPIEALYSYLRMGILSQSGSHQAEHFRDEMTSRLHQDPTIILDINN